MKWITRYFQQRSEEKEREAWCKAAEKEIGEMDRKERELRRFKRRKQASFATAECIADLVASNRKLVKEIQAINTKNIELNREVLELREGEPKEEEA